MTAKLTIKTLYGLPQRQEISIGKYTLHPNSAITHRTSCTPCISTATKIVKTQPSLQTHTPPQLIPFAHSVFSKKTGRGGGQETRGRAFTKNLTYSSTLIRSPLVPDPYYFAKNLTLIPLALQSRSIFFIKKWARAMGREAYRLQNFEVLCVDTSS